jgi:hypothetical protein
MGEDSQRITTVDEGRVAWLLKRHLDHLLTYPQTSRYQRGHDNGPGNGPGPDGGCRQQSQSSQTGKDLF